MSNPLWRRCLRHLSVPFNSGLTLRRPPNRKGACARPLANALLEELESRLAPASFAVNAQLQITHLGEPRALATGVTGTSPAPRAVVFFESSVADYQVLRQGLSTGTDSVVLDSGGDGLREMAAFLASRHDLDTVGLVVHGSSGSIALGTATLNVQNMAAYGSELTVFGSALRPGGELDLWSCAVGAGQAGASLVRDLAAATGARVAAAEQAVGATALGGTWSLDAKAGGAQAAIPFAASARAAFNHVLSASWSPAASLTTARVTQTATLLGNGKVLVTGGLDSNGTALASAELYDPVTDSWSSAGSMATARHFNTATLLGNGKVLVTGGDDNNNNALAKAELYDPITNKWTAAGSMATAREFHTATLLSSGNVLITGGDAHGNPFATAELYDPGKNTWSAAAALSSARTEHTATRLSNGKVLVVGGLDTRGNTLAGGELYDPVANSWSPAGVLTTSRNKQTATLLTSGKVLVVGGDDNTSTVLASAELYDPAANAWSSAGSLTSARDAHTALLLGNGTVLVAGGVNSSGDALAGVEIYDPVANTWSSGAALGLARYGQTATLLSNGKVLAVGGNGASSILASSELYDPDLSHPPGAWNPAASLTTARYNQTATLLGNGKVIVAGGSSSGGFIAGTELYDPTANTWSTVGSLNTPRAFDTATLLGNGKVLAAGGQSSSLSNPALSSAELYDPISNTWSPTVSMATGRYSDTGTLLSNGKVLVAGGLGNFGPLGSAELYDPIKNTWSAAGSLIAGRYNHSATLLGNGKVLVTGGIDINGAALASAELYDPVLNTWSAAGQLATARNRQTATLLPSGKVLVAGGIAVRTFLTSAEIYDPLLNSWSSAGNLATARADHTATLLATGKVLIVGGDNGPNVILNSAELYDPDLNSWAAAGTLAAARQNQTATLLGTGKVLIAAGLGKTQIANIPITSAELYDPAATDPLQSTVAVVPAAIQVGSSATITLTARDAAGIQESQGGLSFSFGLGAGTGGGTISALTDNHNGTYTGTFTATSVGPVTITAILNGQFIISALPSVNVTQAVTSSAVTATPTASTYGQAVTITDAVTAGAAPVTAGTVTFEDGSTILASNVPLDAGGHATFTIANLSALASPHTITAVYSGTAQFMTSTSSTSQVVNPLAITVSADSQSKLVGTPDPALTYRVTTGALVTGDAFTGALTRAAGENVGSYPIQQGSLALSGNYALTYVGANLTISTPVLSKFVVNVQGGNTITAGNAFLVTVQAEDQFGNPMNSYSGPASLPIALTPADSIGTLPSTVALSSSGFGFFLGTLRTKGSYTITVTDTADSIAGATAPLTVTPANAVYFAVATPATAITADTFPVTVTAFDAFNNVATNYAGTVKLSSTDRAAAQAGDLGGAYTFTTGANQDNGVHVFNVKLLSNGAQTITAADTSATMPAILGTSAAINLQGLTVLSFANTPTGFTAAFNKEINPSDLTIFGVGGTSQDVLFVGKSSNNNQPYPGTLVVDASNKRITFNVSANFLAASSPGGSAALPDDTYTVTLASGSGSNGFQDVAGQGLDDGHGGHADFIGSFTTTYQHDVTQVLGIVDFARGPNASGDTSTLVKVSNDPAHGGHVGIPITLYNAANLTSAGFTLTYNANILTVTGGISDPGNASASFQMTSNVLGADGVHSVATFAFTSATPQSGTHILGDITAYVPYAARSQYQFKDVLALGGITVNSGAAVVPANAVDVNAYFGDVNGDHHLDALDKGLIANAASSASTGFTAFTLLDPAIIGDLSGDNAVTANSTSLLSNFLLAFPVAKIPALPDPAIADNLFTSPYGFDPTLSLPPAVSPSVDGVVSVPVQLDHPRPEGSSGLIEAELALTYDPKVLSVSAADITLGSIPSQGTGWQLFAVVGAATGQIGIQIYSQTPITLDQAGSLVNIAFHLKSKVGLSVATTVQLVDSMSVLADAQAAMILAPGRDLTVVLTV